MRRWAVALVVALLVLAGDLSAIQVVPGIFGFGTDTRAAYACGGAPTVIRVTNINASGTGSLRDALTSTHTNGRVVIFETSGTIDLGESDINLTANCVTIAGQTAPSPGVTVKSGGINIYGTDVLMQHMRIRPGDGGAVLSLTADHDATIVYQTANRVVIDHCSFSWTGGKNLDFISLPDGVQATLWRSISSEGLYRAKNVDPSLGERTGPYSLGLLFAQSYVPTYTGFMTAIGNLFAHDANRNPEVQGGIRLQFINNVIYDWNKSDNEEFYPFATFFYYAGDGSLGPLASIVGNRYVAGTGSKSNGLYAIGQWNLPSDARLYLSDNTLDTRLGPITLKYVQGSDKSTGVVAPPTGTTYTGFTPLASTAVQAFVLANVGARPADRDAVDTRLVAEVGSLSNLTSIISSQTAVGGWPTLAVNTRALTVPSNPNSNSGNGYTNLEVWLQSYASAVESGASTGNCSTTTANGARLPGVTDICDGVDDWTLGTGTTPNIQILRNGAVSTTGSAVLFCNATLYAKKSDGHWYSWAGSFTDIGTSDPCPITASGSMDGISVLYRIGVVH